MKRFLCPKHMYHLKTEGKSIQLSTDKCSICRFENRPMTLKDMANQLEGVAYNLRFCHDNPDYDPFGITFLGPLEKTIAKFLKSIHSDYRKNFIKYITNNSCKGV